MQTEEDDDDFFTAVADHKALEDGDGGEGDGALLVDRKSITENIAAHCSWGTLLTLDDNDSHMAKALFASDLIRDRVSFLSLSCSEEARSSASVGTRHLFIEQNSMRNACVKGMLWEKRKPDDSYVVELPDDICVVDLHTSAFPLSAVNILESFLTTYERRLRSSSIGKIVIYLTFVCKTGHEQLEIMNRNVEMHHHQAAERTVGAAVENSKFEAHLDLFQKWAKTDSDFVDLAITSDMVSMVHDVLARRQLLMKRPPNVSGVAAGNRAGEALMSEAFFYEEGGVGKCCLGFQVEPVLADQAGTRGTRIIDAHRCVLNELFFHEEITWGRFPQHLYCPLELAEAVLSDIRQTVLPHITDFRLKGILDDFTDPDLVVVSKIISVLLTHTTQQHDRYIDFLIYGKERAGKSAALMLAVVVANTPSMKAHLESLNRTVRTVLAVGPNTTGPEADAMRKFESVRRFFNVKHVGRKQLSSTAQDGPTDVYVFGDSFSRAEILRDLVKSRVVDEEGRHIDWILIIDESSHIFGRGWAHGELSKAEKVWREEILALPHWRAIGHVDATPIPLFERTTWRVFRRGGGIQVLCLKKHDDYYGPDRVQVSYPISRDESLDCYKYGSKWIDIQDGEVVKYGGIHRCLNDYIDTSPRQWTQTRVTPGGDETIQHQILPLMLMGVTPMVNKAKGMKDLAKALAKGEYQRHRFDELDRTWVERDPGASAAKPVCATYVERMMTIFVEEEEGGHYLEWKADEFLLEHYSDDTDLWPENSTSETKIRKAKSYGDDIGIVMPRVMIYYGVTRPVILLGYGRFARLVSTAFSITHQGRKLWWYCTHAAMRVLKTTKGEYTRCMEDIRQFIFRVLTRTYDGLDLDAAWGQRFQICMATEATIRDDILDHIRTTDLMVYLLSLHRDLEKAHSAMNRTPVPSLLYGRRTHLSTKRKTISPIIVKTVPNPHIQKAYNRTALHRGVSQAWDDLPTEDQMKYMRGKKRLEELVRTEEENLLRPQPPVEEPQGDSLFDVEMEDSVSFTDQERTLLWELYNETGRKKLDIIREKVGRAPNNNSSGDRDSAMELFTSLWAFNFSWQKKNMHVIVRLPDVLRRQGMLCAVLWFGANKRQEKSVGWSEEEIVRLLRLLGYDEPDAQSLTTSNGGKGLPMTLPLLSYADGFYVPHQTFMVRRDRLCEELRPFTVMGSLEKFLDSCQQHTWAVMRKNQTRWVELRPERVLRAPGWDIVERCTGLYENPYAKRGYYDSALLDRLINAYELMVQGDHPPGRRVEAEGWWILMSPWWEFFRGPYDTVDEPDRLLCGAILAILSDATFESGILPADMANLHRMFYGDLRGFESYFECRDEISQHHFIAEKPETHSAPVLTVGEDGRYYPHDAWVRFMKAKDQVFCGGLIYDPTTGVWERANRKKHFVPDTEVTDWVRGEIPILGDRALWVLSERGFKTADMPQGEDQKTKYAVFAQTVLRKFAQGRLRRFASAYDEAICRGFWDSERGRFDRVVSRELLKTRITNLRTGGGRELSTAGFNDFVHHNTGGEKRATRHSGWNLHKSVPLLVKIGTKDLGLSPILCNCIEDLLS
jgi:hypothetical protein